MSTMTRCSAVRYDMTHGGTITVSKAAKGWEMAFDFGDASLNFSETVPSVPAFMEIVRTHCDSLNAVTID